MKKVFNFDNQRKALSDAADNFLCKAEIEMGKKKGDTKIIHEMYSKLFDKVKDALVDGVEQITGKKVKSKLININLETELCIMDFYFASKSGLYDNEALK